MLRSVLQASGAGRSPLLTAGVLMSAIGLAGDAAQADDLAAGKAKAQAVCQTCHGLDGLATTAMVPHLSGQPREYLIIQLQAFRDGSRQHPQMNIIARMLSDDDIENLSEWYSSIRISVELPQ